MTDIQDEVRRGAAAALEAIHRLAAEADASKKTFKIHLLDVSRKKYGDAILVVLGTTRILIDGAHPWDHLYKPNAAAPSIPEQLAQVLGQKKPFHFDALIVTHTHDDHIGCLPEMVADGTITADWALVADEDLGWGDVLSDAAGADRRALAAWAGLREERPVFRSRAELEAFLDEVEKLRDRYAGMLAKLADGGTTVLRYGRDDLAEFEAAFGPEGLSILGPTSEHLEICRGEIEAIGRDFVGQVDASLAADDARTAADLFLEALGRSGQLDASPGGAAAASADWDSPGNAINCQSIVLAVERNGKKVLLTGDMQLADARVDGLEEQMKELRSRIEQGGPYNMVKLPHHGAANGVDLAVLEETGSRLLTISTGPGSSKHPNPKTLDLLRDLKDQLQWLRTDRNGIITVDYTSGDGSVTWQRGEANDLSPNWDPDEAAPAGEEPARQTGRATVGPPARREERGAGAAVVETTASERDDIVEVTARIPRRPTRVALTIEVQPLDTVPRTPGPESGGTGISTGGTVTGSPTPGPGGPAGIGQRETSVGFRLAAGRDLPRLLFATDPEALARNLGSEADVREVVQAIQRSRHPLVTERFARMTAARAAGDIVAEAARTGAKGVVLVGGYDVVPPEVVDVLAPVYRDKVARRNDPDRFYVWSDDIYGTLDNDAIPDLPVSRIPDGHSVELLRQALDADRASVRSRAGLRNYQRPFAEGVFSLLPGNDSCLVSDPTLRTSFPRGTLGSEAVYLMLHGTFRDTGRFEGETAEEEMVDAIGVENVGASPGGVVLCGACWGALIVRTRAWEHDAREPFDHRTDRDSIALAYLRGGANAFVGCTGAHYSPRFEPYNYASGPLHQAFFHNLLKGMTAAEALCQAKVDYIAGWPYPNPVDPGGPGAAVNAVERKLVSQFVCLGLGW